MISHKHKTIFIHIPKTGGQSVEQMFLDDLGLDWSERSELLLRRNSDRSSGPGRLAHLFADEYVTKGHISQALYDSYLTFAVVRHPVDRIVSEYVYRYKSKPIWKRPSPEEFLDFTFEDDFSDLARHLALQKRYVIDADGKRIVDHVLRFETIAADIEALSEQIFGHGHSLPHRNKAKRRSFAINKSKLRQRMADQIREQYQEDFDFFSYSA